MLFKVVVLPPKRSNGLVEGLNVGGGPTVVRALGVVRGLGVSEVGFLGLDAVKSDFVFGAG